MQTKTDRFHSFVEQLIINEQLDFYKDKAPEIIKQNKFEDFNLLIKSLSSVDSDIPIELKQQMYNYMQNGDNNVVKKTFVLPTNVKAYFEYNKSANNPCVNFNLNKEQLNNTEILTEEINKALNSLYRYVNKTTDGYYPILTPQEPEDETYMLSTFNFPLINMALTLRYEERQDRDDKHNTNYVFGFGIRYAKVTIK